jgi:hypothetical protein
MNDESGPSDEHWLEADDPREVGMELLRQLGRLDDRLERSQAFMLDLLDRRMPGRAEGEVVVRRDGLANSSPQEESKGPDADGPPAPTAGEAGTSTFGDGRFPWEPDEEPSGEPAGEPDAAVTPSGPTVVRPPELRRPVWQSNLITAAIAFAVLLVGLAFVGAL